jgi:hypothetical protein
MKTSCLSHFVCVTATALILSGSVYAQAPDQPAVAVPAAPSLADTASDAISGLADKATALGKNIIPENLAIPGMAPAMPERIPGQESGFSEGQDRSITVTSGGKPESIFFTPNQLAAIMRAQQGFLVPREAFDPNNQGSDPTTGGSRVVSLAGIIYVNSKDWVIWLNGERVTRKNMPQRLIGLTVRPTLAHLRWLDVPNQRIVNITLRPHQQYLLDSDTIIPAP